MNSRGSKTLHIFIFVIVMGTVSGIFLVGVNLWTAPLIAKNEEIKIKSAVLDVLEIPYTKPDLLNVFQEKVREIKKERVILYKGPDEAVAFEFYGPGLWGPVFGFVSINSDLKTIRTIKILHQEETPGLGARIAEAAYLNQFRNKEFLPKLLFVPQGKSSAKNEVDAITGATGSSRALERLLNETLQKNISMLQK